METQKLIGKRFKLPVPPPRPPKKPATGKAEKRYKLRDGAGPYHYYLTPSEKKARKEYIEELKVRSKYNDQV